MDAWISGERLVDLGVVCVSTSRKKSIRTACSARIKPYGIAKKLEKDSDESVVEKWLENHLPGLCVCDDERKLPGSSEKFKELFSNATRIYIQKKNDEQKIYSIHAPGAECIAGSKARKKYEFGYKITLATTSTNETQATLTHDRRFRQQLSPITTSPVRGFWP